MIGTQDLVTTPIVPTAVACSESLPAAFPPYSALLAALRRCQFECVVLSHAFESVYRGMHVLDSNETTERFCSSDLSFESVYRGDARVGFQ